MRNIPILVDCTLTFCPFHDSCCFGVSADFRHNPRTRLPKYRDLGVLCGVSSRVRNLIKYYGVFHQLEYTSVDLAAG